MTCPNINSPEWKALTAKIGEQQAWKEYWKNNNQIPDATSYDTSLSIDPGVKEVLNSSVQIFSNSNSGNFDSSLLKDDDLALMLFNKATGSNVKSIEDITFDSIQYDTTKKDFAFFGGFSRDRDPSLSQIMNQKGIYPEHIMFIGESRVYPNFYEILENQNDIVESSVRDNFDKIFSFGFTSTVFDQVKKELNNSKSETFIFQMPDGKTFKFPKRFVKGFYKLTSKISEISEENRQEIITKKVEQSIRDKREANDRGIKPVIVKEFYNDGSTDILKYATELIDNPIIQDAVKNATNIKVVVFSNKEFSQENTAAWYQPNTNSIYIYEENLRIDRGAFQLLAHELIHGVTHLAVNYDANFKRNINSLLNQVKDKTKLSYQQGKEGSVYGLKDEHEFLSEAFSNPDFKKLLEGIKEEVQTELTLWQKFINSVLQLFNKEAKYKTEKFNVSTAEKLNKIIQTNSFMFYNVSNVADDSKLASSKSISESNNIKPGVEELFDSNPELANEVYEALGFNNFSNQEKEQLIEQLRNPLFDLVRGTELYNKYKGETIPYGYSESSWKLLISGINESKLDLNKILLGYKKRLLEEETTPIRETGIDEKTGLPKGFNPSTGQFEGGFGEASEKENAITKSKQKIAVLEKFIEQKQQALQLYSQYLDSIFPDSKVKDIVYHQTDNKIDNFIKRFSKELGYNMAIYFSKLKKDITVFGSNLDEGGKTKFEVAAVINSQTPIESNSLELSKFGNLKQINLVENDSLIINQKSAKERGVEAFSDTPAINWVAVKEPEQIHILGSKQDINGFKEFVKQPVEFSNNNNAVPLSKADLTFYAQRFFKKFGVNFKILSENEFNDNLSKKASGAYDPKDNIVILGTNKSSFNSALHEFTHPLVEWLYKTKPLSFKQFKADILKKRTEESLINELITKKYTSELYSNGKLTERGWREVITTEIENESITILEDLPQKSNIATRFWKQVCNYIKSFLIPDLKNMSDKQIMELSLKDIALFVLDPDTTLDLSNIHLEQYIDPNEVAPSTPEFSNNVGFNTSLTMAISNYAANTGNNITANQIDVINKISKWQKLGSTENEYISPVNGQKYQRATSFLKKLAGPNGEQAYFEYFGDVDLGGKAREFGNQFDDLLQELVNGVDKSSAVQNVLEAHKIRVDKDNAEEVVVNEETLSKTYDELKKSLDKYKNYLIIPQVILGDSNNKIAGTLDLLLISPEGKVKILDLKSTKYSTTSFDYMKTYGSASKKQTHAAQLSIYKGLALTNGLVFEKDDLGVLPVYLPNQKDVLEEAYVEDEVPVNAYSYIVDQFYDAPSKPTGLDNTYNDQQVTLINNIKIILHKRLKSVNKLPDTASKQAALLQTKEVLETLNQAEPIKKLTEFVNALHYQFTNKLITRVDKKISVLGLPAQIVLLNNKIVNGELTQAQAIDKLLYIKTINDLYSPILDDLRFILDSNSDKDLKSEMFSKLEEIQKGVSIINKTYQNQSVDLLADFLLQGVSKTANAEVEKTLVFQKERIDKTTNPKIKEKLTKQYEFDVKKLKSEKGITRDVLIKSLKYGSSEDIAWLDTWFTPAASSSNELISSFDRVLKDKMEDARQKLVKFEREAGAAFEKTSFGNKDNPSDYNQGLYEKVNVFEKLDDQGSPVFSESMSFVSEIDYNKYNQVKANHYKRLNLADNVADEKSLWRNFYKDNFVRIPQSEDVVVINPVTQERIVLQKSIDTLIKEKQKLVEEGVISQNDLTNFINKSNGYTSETGTTYDKEFLMLNPTKFKNDKYEQLKASPKFEYYKFLVASYFKSQERLPHKMGYILPSIKKSGWDSVTDKGLVNHLKYVGSELISFKDEEVSKYGEDGKTIPMIFNFNMKADDVSLDLIQSIVMYEAESLEYEVKSKMANVGEMLLENVTKNAPYKTDDAGNKYVDALVEKAGVKDEFLKYKKKLGGNNIASLLAMHIDNQIYGKLDIKTDQKVLGVPVDKLIGGLMSFASVTQVGGNPIGSVANYLQANIQALMESAAKQFFSDTAWLKSRAIYDGNITNFIKDFNSPYSKSLLGQLVDLYDPMQGEYKDSAGRNISKTAFKKLFNTDTWFFMQQQGEHAIQVRTMIAMLLDTKVTTNKGEVITLFDAYTLDKTTGEIKLKEGVNIQAPSENGLISRDIQSTLHGLNKRMHGIYNSQDKIQIERYSAGKLLTMYKKFLLPGIKKRYKSKGIDQELGVITEGYWITFYKHLATDVKQLSRFIAGVDNGYYSPAEKQNLRRARRELLIVAASGMFIIILNSLMEAGDDDEKAKLKHLLYLSMRINSELGIYGTFGDPQNFLGMPSVKEVYKTVKNPIPVFSVLDRLSSLLTQMTDPFAVYKRDSGIWEKGDSKLWAKFLKFWGYNGVNSDPENAIKYMKMTTK
jgi:hypothetical protein